MRELTRDEISKLAAREGVRPIAVENFLGTMGTDASNARANLQLDARLYGWKTATVKAIRDGIALAERK